MGYVNELAKSDNKSGFNAPQTMTPTMTTAPASAAPKKRMNIFERARAAKQAEADAAKRADPMYQMHQQQIGNAKDFRANMGQTYDYMSDQLRQQSTAGMNDALGAITSSNSRRGMLYGGVNEGQKQKTRAGFAGNLAQAKSGVSRGLIDQANELDLQAIQTGVQMQQSQQSMQNAIYQNALAKMNSDNAAFGGLLQVGGMGYGMWLASDIRLKRDIERLDLDLYKTVPTYKFRYLDSDLWHIGTMAQDLLAIDPNHPAVRVGDDGFYMVNYAEAI